MKRLKRLRGRTSKGFAISGFPNENILKLTVESSAQAGKGIEVYVAGCA
jgi:hypothetical protein